MNFELEELEEYYGYVEEPDFIPCHAWNKQIDNIPRGKSPVHSNWQRRQYNENEYKEWIKSGYNVGYRISANECVVDIDPRNFDPGINTLQRLANDANYENFDDLLDDNVVVRTGGGGYHIYTSIDDIDHSLLREVTPRYPGVEFKTRGRQVLAAGSKHQETGNIYKFVRTMAFFQEPLPRGWLEHILRPARDESNKINRGCLNNEQLWEMILSKLDVRNYASNDEWFSMLCGSHHATDGAGIEAFLRWSLLDPEYADQETSIRNRWESIGHHPNHITIASLLDQLKKYDIDFSDVRAVIAFEEANISISQSSNAHDDADDNFEAAQQSAMQIDLSDIYKIDANDIDIDQDVDAACIEKCKELTATSSDDDIMTALRLIKAASTITAAKAKDLLVANKVLKISAINKIMKSLDQSIAQDLALTIAQTTLNGAFNSGKHIVCPPSGGIYNYDKRKWSAISELYLNKIIQATLAGIKDKIELKSGELSMITQATKLTTIASASKRDVLYSTDLPKPIINCKNGEIHIRDDGSHTLESHDYRSYQLSCLDVDYDPSAKCPLFMQTINEIFADHEDSEDVVDYIAEIFGYMLQPYKNLPNWWLFRGNGGDGKSTLLQILGAVLGDAQVACSKSLLKINSETGDRHGLTKLVGALNLIIEELPVDFMLNDDMLKMLSANCRMTANPKFGAEFQFMYAAGLIMCSNGYPYIRDVSHGFSRRANVVPFLRQFTKESTQDVDRVRRIIEDPVEMSGVLNWMLTGLQRLRDRGNFKVPESCKRATAEWLGESNNINRFIVDHIEKTGDPNDIVGSFKDIYTFEYLSWCQNNDIDERYRIKKQSFKRQLEMSGFTVKNGHGNRVMIYGGKLIDEDF